MNVVAVAMSKLYLVKRVHMFESKSSYISPMLYVEGVTFLICLRQFLYHRVDRVALSSIDLWLGLLDN
jgi:hypothetical protein